MIFSEIKLYFSDPSPVIMMFFATPLAILTRNNISYFESAAKILVHLKIDQLQFRNHKDYSQRYSRINSSARESDRFDSKITGDFEYCDNE